MPITDPVFIAALESEASPIFPIVLLTLDHPDLVVPLRYCSDNQVVIHGGDAYAPKTFQSASIPAQGITQQALPQATLTLGDPGGEIYRALRIPNPLLGPVTVEFKIVGSHDPNTVQLGPFFYLLQAPQEAPPSINLFLSGENFLNEPLPSQAFNKGGFPNLFGGLRVNQ